MFLRIERRIGIGWAAHSIEAQKHFVPALQNCFSGSINGYLSRLVQFQKFTFLSASINWDVPKLCSYRLTVEGNRREPCGLERIGLVSCRIFLPGKIVKGFVYVTEHSRLRKDPRNIEVVAEWIPDLPQTFVIEVPTECVLLQGNLNLFERMFLKMGWVF